jgi:hypothetical protein
MLYVFTYYGSPDCDSDDDDDVDDDDDNTYIARSFDVRLVL